jgi:voltage-gated potassium channel
VEKRDIARRFRLPLALTAGIMLYGIVGYAVIIPGATPLDGLYWTVLTLGGVGFRDTQLAGPGAEMFSISLILGLLVAVIVTAAIGSDLVASGDLARARRRRRMKRKIEALEAHFILCGFGRVGRAVVAEYRRAGVGVIVIEIDPRSAEELDDLGVPYLIADPQNDGVLEEAGIHRARGIICAVDSDAINAFIALSARTLNPDLVVVARAADPGSVSKLARVGADHVVSPYTLTGHRMATDSLMPRDAGVPDTIGPLANAPSEGVPAS